MSLTVSQSAFAAALLDPSHAVPAGLISARGRCDPARFAVYRNNVFVGLTEALKKRFPVVRMLVGDDFFAGMARVYAGLEKPASPLLFTYGDTFAQFVGAFPPAACLPYLADVARVEAAWTRAYHAADLPVLTLEALSALDPAQLAATRLIAHPATTLIVSSYPVASIWSAHQQTPVRPVASHQAETVLIARPGLDVTVHCLPRSDSAFAAALFAGQTIGDAASAAHAADACFDFGAALVGLTQLGAFTAFAREEMSDVH